MRVIAINSSGRRRGNTYALLSQIQTLLKKEGIEMDIINLFDYQLKDCVGCEYCLYKGTCHQEDDFLSLEEKIKEYDGIILASPVYLRSVSGKMKDFTDRTCSWYHRPFLYGKPVLSVSTTKGSGLKYTLDYLTDIGLQWGMLPSGSVGRSIRNIQDPVQEKELKRFVRNLKLEKRKHKPSLKCVMDFTIQKVLAYTLGGIDYEYWKSKGWFEQDYFYPCKINIFKRLLSRSLFSFLSRIMKKAAENNK